MTGSFSSVDPGRCQHYAQFMKRLNRRQADIIFWILFVVTIILLIIASSMYTKASKTLLDPETGSVDRCRHQKVRQKCLVVSSVCFVLGVVAGILEAFALFTIQFCDGEDLMMLYWSFWTLLQVGSFIAILGIVLNQWYELSGKELPPWNIALGTPVLVIAGVAHSWLNTSSSLWKKWRENRKKTNQSEVLKD